jgi:uncharacterized membrane protein HdeD (DUF308 family)
MKRSQWRTVIVALVGIVASLVGLLVVAHWPAANGAYPAFCGAVGFCVGAVSAKAFGEHKVNPEPLK